MNLTSEKKNEVKLKKYLLKLEKNELKLPKYKR